MRAIGVNTQLKQRFNVFIIKMPIFLLIDYLQNSIYNIIGGICVSAIRLKL